MTSSGRAHVSRKIKQEVRAIKGKLLSANPVVEDAMLLLEHILILA